MKNRITVVFIATIINIGLFAQNEGDSLKVMKNEIGVNLIPFINLVNSETNHNPIANVFFKRQLKNNWYGRASLILLNDNTENYPLYMNALPNSKLSIEYTQNNSNRFLQYNIGVEKRFGKGKIKQFTGFDIGYIHYKMENKLLYAVRDSLALGYYNPSGFKTETDSVISHTKKTNNGLVFNPFYGAQFNISKHFFFSAQAGLALSIISENKKSLIYNTSSIKVASADFRLNSNFSVCYRF